MTEVENTIQSHHVEVERLGIGSIGKILNTLEKIKSEIKKDDDINITKYREIEKAIADIKKIRHKIGETLTSEQIRVNKYNVASKDGDFALKDWEHTTPEKSSYYLIVDAHANCYIANVNKAYKILKLNSEGNKEWEYTYKQELAKGMGVDSEGNVYLGTYNGKILKLNSRGNKEWEIDIGKKLFNMKVDEKGNIYTADYTGIGKYNTWGSKQWYNNVRTVPSQEFEIDSEGNVYIDSQTGNLLKYNSEGEYLWGVYIAYKAIGIKIDEIGNVYIVAGRSGSNNSSDVIKISETGEKIWSCSGYADYYFDASHTEIALDLEGNVYVVQGHLRKINKNGELEWVFDDGDTEAIFSFPVVVNDKIYVGDKKGNILKINKNGKKIWESKIGDLEVVSLVADKKGNRWAQMGNLSSRATDPNKVVKIHECVQKRTYTILS